MKSFDRWLASPVFILTKKIEYDKFGRSSPENGSSITQYES